MIYPVTFPSLALYLGLSLVKATGTLLRMLMSSHDHAWNSCRCNCTSGVFFFFLALEPYLEAAKVDVNRVYIVINLVGFCVISALCMYCADRLVKHFSLYVFVSLFILCSFYFSLNVFHHASPWRSPLLMSLFAVAIVCLGFLKTVKLNQVGINPFAVTL